MVKYLVEKTVFLILTLLIGLTMIFIISRSTPIHPIDTLMQQLSAYGAQLTQQQYNSIKDTYLKLYGLNQPVISQYFSFLAGIFSGDFGPSFSAFPTPVMSLIERALPWTVGLLLTALIISWILGNLAGLLAGFFDKSNISKFFQGLFVVLSPVPYPIIALLLILFFVFMIPSFPIMGGTALNIKVNFSLSSVLSILEHAFLPALSIVISSLAGWFLTMRSLVMSIKSEDFIEFAKLRGLKKRKIIFSYVMRNVMSPQITALALNIGFIFNGALVTEYLFSYPGLGTLMYRAILTGDMNTLVGVASLSVIGITLATFIVELMIPIIDPTIRQER
ncbi:MAG: ABC transporter permease [Sulfolobaceae archaeon]|nr:ABC transporter permease [Candidatus Jingweiarchaeum tengchongense]